MRLISEVLEIISDTLEDEGYEIAEFNEDSNKLVVSDGGSTLQIDIKEL